MEKVCRQGGLFSRVGITDVWLPPAYKAIAQDNVGYTVLRSVRLGEFDQKGIVRTKYGTKGKYVQAVRAFHENGINATTDIVLNHRAIEK